MNVRPLTGQVLVELDKPDRTTASGLAIPDHTKSAEEVQASHRMPEKPPAITGTVRAIGPWPKTSKGLALMPEFGVGMKVVLPRHSGQEMRRDIGERFKMVRNQDVLAVLTEILETKIEVGYTQSTYKRLTKDQHKSVELAKVLG